MEKLSVKALRELARELGLTGYSKLRKEELLAHLKKAKAKKKPAAKVASDKTAETAKPVSLTTGGETEEERIESAKYFFPQTHEQYPQDLGEDIDHLPSLAEPRLTLLLQKPGVLQASWSLVPGHRARQPGLQLRLGLMANRRFQVLQEVDVTSDIGTYYFHVDSSWPPGGIFLQLGFVDGGGRFVIAIPRGIVRLPRLLALTSLGVNWALEEDEFERAVAQSGALTRTSGQPLGAPSSQEWITSGAMPRRE
jgi:hypothetical protein